MGDSVYLFSACATVPTPAPRYITPVPRSQRSLTMIDTPKAQADAAYGSGWLDRE